MDKDTEDILYALWFHRKILEHEENQHERNTIDKTIRFWFEKADEKGIPFRIQNIAIHYGEKQEYFYDCTLPYIKEVWYDD